ncbi:AAA family ATPase [Actinomadura decatromicini]|uniref:AAA family ATPase n=1 Tax=Actinomadura decatromicini TaxID=2604572 RepID=A0A5D3FJL4_9ACTN|nr:ATP-binding protein [Actinomadura decatromicini]TYK48413.1 AAA family ATPase [Actinomadura decatromicini]
MITRVEIDGFKSFLDFKLDVPPFLALVGPNASGKSNLFDAIAYCLDSRRYRSDAILADRRGRPVELFHMDSAGRPVDEFGVTLRCLLNLPDGLAGIEAAADARLENGVPQYQNDHTGILDLAADTSLPKGVRARESREIHDSFNDDARFSDTVVAIDAALTQVLFYPGDPRAMRSVASLADQRPLRSDGANLAAVLGRMGSSSALDDLMVDLAALVPDVREVRTELDEKRQEWSFELVLEGQGSVPSTLLSDGTLRILGLLAALHDPDHAGVLLVEEIENGLHPGRLAELLRRIQERVTDLNDPASLDRPLRQVIITSHSPVVVSELYRSRPEALVFMDTAVRVDPDKERVSRVTVAKSVRDGGEPGTFVSPRQVRKYLGTVRQDEL